MQPDQRLGDRRIEDRTDDAHTDGARLKARRLCRGGRPPAVYRTTDLSTDVWNRIWPRLLEADPIRLAGPSPAPHTDDVLVLFDGPETPTPLGLSFRLVDNLSDGCLVAGTPPPLSWRLAGVQLGRSLPSHPPIPQAATASPCPEPDSLNGRRLRLRPDIPCPAETLAPGDDLPAAIHRLRAKFCTVPELIEQTSCPAPRLRPYLAVLETLDIVVDAPSALESWRNPFDFLGLHWSAHDPLVRRRYIELASRAHQMPDIAGVDAKRFLERAYTLLCRSEDRRRIRRQILPPSTRVEAGEFFRRRLRELDHHTQTRAAVDAARRILELEPSDRAVCQLLTELLCQLNSTD